MSSKAGVWIDHRKALIVGLTPDGVFSTTILSAVEKHPQRGGDSPLRGSYDASQVPADDSRQRALTGALNIYYDSVIKALREFSNLLIMGPGEAKGQLHARLLHGNLGGRVAAVKTAGKMTDRQIIADVKAYYVTNAVHS